MRRRPCIYFVLNPANRYARSIYKGACDYFQEKAMNFELSIAYDEALIEKERPIKGIIVIAAETRTETVISSYRVPAVNVSSSILSPKLPSVHNDNQMAGRMAAEYLLNLRFHSYAYYGRAKSMADVTLGRSFKKTVENAGFSCTVQMLGLKDRHGMASPTLQKKLRLWIASLPKPVGIFCSDDFDAWEVWNACDLNGLQIGREVGIVGHGNDELYCLTRHPQLSSVETRPDLIGYEAAALLRRLMRGASPPKKPILMPPAGVIQRASTDTFVSTDRHVQTAIQFIRDHIDTPLKVDQVFKHVPMSRRTLERRFHQTT
ncbi:MAG: substrate-binding domain-containing protein, partial [Chthoniobacterales bacterium]